MWPQSLQLETESTEEVDMSAVLADGVYVSGGVLVLILIVILIFLIVR